MLITFYFFKSDRGLWRGNFVSEMCYYKYQPQCRLQFSTCFGLFPIL